MSSARFPRETEIRDPAQLEIEINESATLDEVRRLMRIGVARGWLEERDDFFFLPLNPEGARLVKAYRLQTLAIRAPEAAKNLVDFRQKMKAARSTTEAHEVMREFIGRGILRQDGLAYQPSLTHEKLGRELIGIYRGRIQDIRWEAHKPPAAEPEVSQPSLMEQVRAWIRDIEAQTTMAHLHALMERACEAGLVKNIGRHGVGYYVDFAHKGLRVAFLRKWKELNDRTR